MMIEIFTDGRVFIDGREVADEEDTESMIREFLLDPQDGIDLPRTTE